MNRMSMAAAALFLSLAAAEPAPCQPALTVIRAEKAFTGQAFVENIAIIIHDGLIQDVVPAGGYAPHGPGGCGRARGAKGGPACRSGRVLHQARL